jgi:hypothetical protein
MPGRDVGVDDDEAAGFDEHPGPIAPEPDAGSQIVESAGR